MINKGYISVELSYLPDSEFNHVLGGNDQIRRIDPQAHRFKWCTRSNLSINTVSLTEISFSNIVNLVQETTSVHQHNLNLQNDSCLFHTNTAFIRTSLVGQTRRKFCNVVWAAFNVPWHLAKHIVARRLRRRRCLSSKWQPKKTEDMGKYVYLFTCD